MAARNSGGDGLPIVQGLMVGAAVWVVSAILMFVAAQALGAGALFQLIGPVTIIMLLMLGANAGGVLMGGATAGFTGTGLVFLLIPIFGAVIGGFVIASQTRSDGLQAGATVAAGFFALQILAVVLLMVMFGGGMSGMGQLVVGLLVGGLVQPAIFGAIGGAFAGS